MPISLAELNSLQAEAKAELYKGKSIKIVYRLDVLADEETLQEIDGALGNPSFQAQLQHGAAALQKLLVSWEITGDDGQTLAITEENLKRVGLRVVDRILGAILRDRDPNLIKGDSSAPSNQDL